MKISTKTRYGLRALIYIAEETANSQDRLVRIKEISESQSLSIQYLEQILFKLKKGEIIEGKRGPNGGYKLTKNPKDINVLDVFQCLETNVEVVFCDQSAESCVKEDCRTACLWEKLNNSITEILRETTLEELMACEGKN